MIKNIEITGIKNVIRGINNMMIELNKPDEPLNKSGRFMQLEAFANFPAKGAVFGEKWPALKASTKKRKAIQWQGRPMMVRTGHLFGGFRVRKRQRKVEVYNPVIYAKEHQWGMSSKNLPRRVLLKLAKRQLKGITDIFSKWVVMSIRKSFQ